MEIAGAYERRIMHSTKQYPYATSAYRNIFAVAKEVAGSDFRITENNREHTGEDVAIGLIDSQRTVLDTNQFTPRIAQNGLFQWYRNRTTKILYCDVKNYSDTNTDLRRAQITGNALMFGTVSLGESVTGMSEQKIKDIGRSVPMPVDGNGVRSIGMFDNAVDTDNQDEQKISDTFDYRFSNGNDDHILLMWNFGTTEAKEMSVNLGEAPAFGGIGLDPEKEYEVWDFWDWKYVGCFSGDDILTLEVRPEEMKTLAVREKQNIPQVVSTNRHILQGAVDVSNVSYDSKTHQLSGTFSVVKDDTYKAIISLNSEYLTPSSLVANGEDITSKMNYSENEGYIEIIIDSSENQDIDWTVKMDYSGPDGDLESDDDSPSSDQDASSDSDTSSEDKSPHEDDSLTDSPLTGEQSKLLLFLILCFASIAGVTVFCLYDALKGRTVRK